VAEKSINPLSPWLIGYGEDSHRLGEGRELWLGGVRIESERGAIAHSDGDVILHALSDALLSAFALGDIGSFFPDHDPKWKGLESRVILEVVLQKVRDNGYRLGQISAVVVVDRPRLGPHRATIQQNLAQLTGLPENRVGLTFKTSEGLALDHAQCRAMVYLEPIPERPGEKG
jgi:2-C-methyl-D-erythritol 2,4-cyclodiphosphate synthase